MRAIIDLNIVLDVVQRREPQYTASALVLSRAAERRMEGVLPSHALPILHTIVGRCAGSRSCLDARGALGERRTTGGVTGAGRR